MRLGNRKRTQRCQDNGAKGCAAGRLRVSKTKKQNVNFEEKLAIAHSWSDFFLKNRGTFPRNLQFCNLRRSP
jgi:hypothetical protein